MTTGRRFAVEVDEDSSTLRVSGEVDYRDVDQLTRTLHAWSDRDVVLDLSDVAYLPSVAIGRVVGAQRRAVSLGHRVEVVAGPGSVAAQVLRVAGIPHRAA